MEEKMKKEKKIRNKKKIKKMNVRILTAIGMLSAISYVLMLLDFPIPLMPIIELVGVFTKPFVLMVRLFANIAAGHIVTLGFFSLIFVFGNMSIATGYAVSVGYIAFTIFMSFLELLVAFIQALVFTLLSAIYFGMAVEEHQ
jgi:F-type H+-transporting ATPase subunit a